MWGRGVKERARRNQTWENEKVPCWNKFSRMQDIILCFLSTAPKSKNILYVLSPADFPLGRNNTLVCNQAYMSLCGMPCWVANKYRKKTQKLVILDTLNIYSYSQNIRYSLTWSMMGMQISLTTVITHTGCLQYTQQKRSKSYNCIKGKAIKVA